MKNISESLQNLDRVKRVVSHFEIRQGKAKLFHKSQLLLLNILSLLNIKDFSIKHDKIINTIAS